MLAAFGTEVLIILVLILANGFFAGLILKRLGRIPAIGECAEVGEYTFEVVDMDGQRIDRGLIRRRETL